MTPSLTPTPIPHAGPSVGPRPGQRPWPLEGLLAGVAGGDRQAFAEVHRRLAPRVFSIITLLVPSSGDARRITDEVFAQVWRTAGAFDPRTGMATPWVMTIAREQGLEHARRRDRVNHS